MKRTKQDYLNLLEETANFYNSKNRGVSSKGLGYCVYEDEKGNRCAVGRCLTSKAIQQLKEDKHNSGPGVGEINDIYGLENLLKDKYKGFNLQFWSELQGFHDDRRNWDENGLTMDGKLAFERLEEIIKKTIFFV